MPALIALALTVGSGDVPEAAARIAATIDRQVAAKLAAAGETPAPRCDDAAFLRRVHLDLAGRIPEASAVRAFLADGDEGKRERVVAELLGDAVYVHHFADVLRSWLVPTAAAGEPGVATQLPGFEAWLRRNLRRGVGLDGIAYQLLTTDLGGGRGGPAVRLAEDDEPSAKAFYVAGRGEPARIAAGVSRALLGLRLECAQCHDHPFADWRQEQFWQFAAFFGNIRGNTDGGSISVAEVGAERRLEVADLGRSVEATAPDGAEIAWLAGDRPRDVLAEWVIGYDNPYFARAMANRIWAHLMGVGLVDPADDLDVHNPPSHPELLDALAEELAEADFDLKTLLHGIVLSEAYQRSSGSTDGRGSDPRLYARRTVKGLSAEQLFESLLQAGGRPPAGPEIAAVKRRFVTLHRSAAERPIDSETSILQALELMNVAGAPTATDGGVVPQALVSYPGLTADQQVEAAYLSVLSRKPDDGELAAAREHLGRSENRQEGLADLCWALLNGSEFRLNH